MSVTRASTRLTRTVLYRCRNSLLRFARLERRHLHSCGRQSLFPNRPIDQAVPGLLSLLHHSALNSSCYQRFGFSSSVSPQPDELGNKVESEASSGVDASVADAEIELSKDELVKLVAEKDQILLSKEEEINKMKDKVLRTLAEMENVKERTRRESENTKKFAIQNFAKSLLDVADNLSRASSAAKESFCKIDSSKDTAGAVQQLKILLDGVEMTEKQLSEVLKKFGLERYDPINEEFDPNRHNAVFQVPDASKPANHVAVVLKAGYMLHDRVIRPAEVGVTVAMGNEER